MAEESFPKGCGIIGKEIEVGLSVYQEPKKRKSRLLVTAKR